MPTPQASAGYDRAGTWHEVLVTRDPAGRWQVIDAAGSQVTLVETLTGHDDRLHQARRSRVTMPTNSGRITPASARPTRDHDARRAKPSAISPIYAATRRSGCRARG